MRKLLQNTSATSILFLLETFQPSLLTHASPVHGFKTPSAWPPNREYVSYPNGVLVTYDKASDDNLIHNVVAGTSARLREAAMNAQVHEAQLKALDAAKYANYANWQSSPDSIWGESLPALRRLKERYDPAAVMQLTGGFKL